MFYESAWLNFMITPFGTNSIPAPSNATFIQAIVLSLKESPLSNLDTVSGESFAARAKSRTPHPMAVRAILHCKGDNRNTGTISVAGYKQTTYRNSVLIMRWRLRARRSEQMHVLTLKPLRERSSFRRACPPYLTAPVRGVLRHATEPRRAFSPGANLPAFSNGNPAADHGRQAES